MRNEDIETLNIYSVLISDRVLVYDVLSCYYSNYLLKIMPFIVKFKFVEIKVKKILKLMRFRTLEHTQN